MTIDDVEIRINRPLRINDDNFWVDVIYKDTEIKVFCKEYLPVSVVYENCIRAMEDTLNERR